MSVDLHGTAVARLRSDGQRYTANRRALVEVLAGARRPLTIPEILGSDPDLAQSSAYRNLAVLERAGVVRRIVTSDEWVRYELGEDLTGHHHHLVCTGCGAVADVVVSAELEERLGRELDVLAAQAGFRVDHHRLDLVGSCSSCSSSRGRAPVVVTPSTVSRGA